MSEEMPPVDLRSDTVTLPSPRMRDAMAAALVGDDVYGEDPTVNRLERSVADLADKEAGLFLPSGTQSNLVALLSHCERGDEYIVGADAHCYRFEAGGGAVLGSIQPQPITLSQAGCFDLAELRGVIKPDDSHFARTRLITFENTYHGRVVPLAHITEVSGVAKRRGLSMHLDGARAWNAAEATDLALSELLAPFDSASLCLSKGLAAPIGSVLVGDETFIARARRWRKMAGGGMRQAGILAAAGLVALEECDALRDDHRRAADLCRRLEAIDGIEVDVDRTETNMVFVALPGVPLSDMRRRFADLGVLLSPGKAWTRLVIHRDIDDRGVDQTVEAFVRVAASEGAREARP